MVDSGFDEDHRVALVGGMGGGIFRPVEQVRVSESALGESQRFLETVWVAGRAPHQVDGYRLRACLAEEGRDDLFEHSWSQDGASFRVVESINGLRLEIPLPPKGAGRLEEGRRHVQSSLRLRGEASGQEYSIGIDWPAELVPGLRFSSDPEADIALMRDWTCRIDFIVRDDRLDVYLYKKWPQLIGFRDGSRWLRSESG